jgi:hypothetical protein
MPKLKSWLFPPGRSVRAIRGGLLRGIPMQVDFACHTQRWSGLYERELYPWFVRLSRGIKTAIDVGANDGYYTLYFAKGTSAERIFAFEPSSECLNELRENLRVNEMRGRKEIEISPLQIGAASSQGTTTLDSIRSKIFPPCLIKVDIEGYEKALLEGAAECLAMDGMRWIIEIHSADLKLACAQILQNYGYKVMAVKQAWWRSFLPELRPADNDWLIAFRE